MSSSTQMPPCASEGDEPQRSPQRSPGDARSDELSCLAAERRKAEAQLAEALQGIKECEAEKERWEQSKSQVDEVDRRTANWACKIEYKLRMVEETMKLINYHSRRQQAASWMQRLLR